MSDLERKQVRFPSDHLERIEELCVGDESFSDFVRAILRPFLTGELVAVRGPDGQVVEVIDGDEIFELSKVAPRGNPGVMPEPETVETV